MIQNTSVIEMCLNFRRQHLQIPQLAEVKTQREALSEPCSGGVQSQYNGMYEIDFSWMISYLSLIVVISRKARAIQGFQDFQTRTVFQVKMKTIVTEAPSNAAFQADLIQS